MDAAVFRDELYVIREKYQRTMTGMDYGSILSESLAAYERAAAGKSAEEQLALRRKLEVFLFTRVAALLLPADYRAFVKLLKASGVNGDAIYGRKGRLIPGRFLKLRIFLFMVKTDRMLFFENQYKLFEKRRVQLFFRFVRRVISERSLEPFRYLLPGHLRIPVIEVVLTTRCTLRCRHCGILVNLYEHPRDTDDATVRKTLEKLQEYADQIGEIVLFGGEPFCDPHIKEYIRAISPAVCRRIRIITNGTIFPDDPELLDVMKEKNVLVSFSNYGELSCKQDEFAEQLRARGIDHVLESPHHPWYDFGGVEERARDRKQLDRQYAKCGSCSLNVLNGVIHACGRSVHIDNLGIVRIPEDECVDLFSLDRREFIRQMKKRLLYRSKAPTVCRYCSYGDDAVPVPRAEQEPRRGA